MEKIILHIDMNAFFASIEQAANPFIRNKPVAVCGRGRTVIVTASYEARRFGIKTGMTPLEATKKCPDLILVEADHPKYTYTSARMIEILEDFTDKVEIYSIDEAFLDITGTDAPLRTAEKIKKRIKEELGLSCSIGIAGNKMLAKLASEMKKPDGLTEIRREDIPGLMKRLRLDSLCGIGKKTSDILQNLGIMTAEELGGINDHAVFSYFGFRGYILKKLGRGEAEEKVRAAGETEKVRSVGHSYTMPRDTTRMEIILSYLLRLSEMVASRLRKYGLTGRTVTLVVRYSDFRTSTRQGTAKDPMNRGIGIYRMAKKILDERFMPLRMPVRLLGVGISSLNAGGRQLLLLRGLWKDELITRTVDRINRKYGCLTIHPASLLISERFGHIGPAIPPYTHEFADLRDYTSNEVQNPSSSAGGRNSSNTRLSKRTAWENRSRKHLSHR